MTTTEAKDFKSLIKADYEKDSVNQSYKSYLAERLIILKVRHTDGVMAFMNTWKSYKISELENALELAIQYDEKYF